MSIPPDNVPYQPPQNPAYQAMPPQEQNSMGLAGFIISMCGLLCAIGFPIGLIISLCGLRREPKGFAIAGTIIGAAGSLMLLVCVLVYGVMIAACIGIGAAAIPYSETSNAIRTARDTIDDYETDNGQLPDEAEGNELIGDLKDGWDKELRYELNDGEYEIRSAGPDGIFDTGDDQTLDDIADFDMDDFDIESLEDFESLGDFEPSTTTPVERDDLGTGVDAGEKDTSTEDSSGEDAGEEDSSGEDTNSEDSSDGTGL